MCKILKEKGKECLKSKFKLKKKKDSYTDIHSHIDKRVYRPSETLHSLVKNIALKAKTNTERTRIRTWKTKTKINCNHLDLGNGKIYENHI